VVDTNVKVTDFAEETEALNQNLTQILPWKLVGTATGGTQQVVLPQDFNELHISVKITWQNNVVVLDNVFTKVTIESLTSALSNQLHVGGVYFSNSNYGYAMLKYEPSTNGIHIDGATWNAQTQTATSVMTVEYR
jgi:hypothetical protein